MTKTLIICIKATGCS